MREATTPPTGSKVSPPPLLPLLPTQLDTKVYSARDSMPVCIDCSTTTAAIYAPLQITVQHNGLTDMVTSVGRKRKSDTPPLSTDTLDSQCTSAFELGHSNESTHESSAMIRAKLRRKNKPLMEKKRRERINICLEQLKSILMQVTQRESSYFTKLEKADILEQTVKYLEDQKRSKEQNEFKTSSTEGNGRQNITDIRYIDINAIPSTSKDVDIMTNIRSISKDITSKLNTPTTDQLLRHLSSCLQTNVQQQQEITIPMTTTTDTVVTHRPRVNNTTGSSPEVTTRLLPAELADGRVVYVLAPPELLDIRPVVNRPRQTCIELHIEKRHQPQSSGGQQTQNQIDHQQKGIGEGKQQEHHQNIDNHQHSHTHEGQPTQPISEGHTHSHLGEEPCRQHEQKSRDHKSQKQQQEHNESRRGQLNIAEHPPIMTATSDTIDNNDPATSDLPTSDPPVTDVVRGSRTTDSVTNNPHIATLTDHTVSTLVTAHSMATVILDGVWRPW